MAQSPLKLFTAAKPKPAYLALPFLSAETEVPAALCSPTDPDASLCARQPPFALLPRCGVAPPFGVCEEQTLLSMAIVLICWPYCTSAFLLIHYILKHHAPLIHPPQPSSSCCHPMRSPRLKHRSHFSLLFGIWLGPLTRKPL